MSHLSSNTSQASSCGQWLIQSFTDDLSSEGGTSDDDDDDDNEEDPTDAYPFGDVGDVDNDDQPLNSFTEETIQGTYPLPPEPGSHPHVRQYHPNHCQSFPGGLNLLQNIDCDQYAHFRNSGSPYYPFASQSEWEVADWLSSCPLSQDDINRFLHLPYIKANPLSFNTAKDLRARIEALPDVPRWHYQEIKIPNYKTKTPIILYWRDGLEVVKHLFGNPVFAPCMDYDPYQEFEATPLGRERIYGEFMSADHAWQIQDTLPPGHGFLGVIGASDKTPLTMGSRNKEMHPLLLSIANIRAGVRMKATSHSYALAAYLPIPKFLDVSAAEQSVLAARVYHKAISIVTQGLKTACREGVAMSDPNGQLRTMHTPLVAWIGDLPEHLTIACASSKNSPISLATADHFGDPDPHPPRQRQHILEAIRNVTSRCNPLDVVAFHKICLEHHLNGVDYPFWEDWGDACPSVFLTPDALHQWHKFYFDHCLTWVINIIGGAELDRRLSVLQRRTGTRHWPNGISTAKQCSGRDHRELERVLVAVAAGAVPGDVLSALRAITEFIFLAQSLYHCDETLHSLTEALREFHHCKASIISAGGRQGKNGPLLHFRIPKLELAQHVARSTRAMGAPYQWSSDITERCHITHVKTPYRMSNRRDFHPQCTRWLDRLEKRRLFRLFTTIKGAGAPLVNEMAIEANLMAGHYPEYVWISGVSPEEQHISPPSAVRSSLFDSRRSRISRDESVAILLTQKPHFPKVSIIDAPSFFSVPDLHAALGDFFSRRSYLECGGRRVSTPNCPLPFVYINGWNKFRIQRRSVQDPSAISPAQTVQAIPPGPDFPGRGNTVLVRHESGEPLSPDALEDRYSIAQVRVILQPHLDPPCAPLVYVEFFKFSTAHFEELEGSGLRMVTPASRIEMFVVERRLRSNGRPLGDIIPLDDILQVVQLVPKFGSTGCPPHMTCDNCLDVAREFFVNSFADKETFHAILSIQ